MTHTLRTILLMTIASGLVMFAQSGDDSTAPRENAPVAVLINFDDNTFVRLLCNPEGNCAPSKDSTNLHVIHETIITPQHTRYILRVR